MIRSLKSKLTILALLLGLLLISLDGWRTLYLLEQRTMDRLMREADIEGVRMAGSLQYFFRNAMKMAAEMETSHAALVQDLNLVLVCDERGIVRHSTQIQWQGRKLNDTPLGNVSAEVVRQVQEHMEGTIIRDQAAGNVIGAFPFFTTYDDQDRGVLLLDYDASAALERARGDALRESMLRACLLGAACVLLWLVLEWLVTERVEELLRFTTVARSGVEAVAPRPRQDELGIIAQSFVEAVHDIRSAELRQMEVAEQERRRIGADMHDDVCQRMVAAQLKSGVLESVLQREGQAQAALANTVASDLMMAVKVMRGFARGLAPMLVQKGRLAEALSHMAETLSASFSVRCEQEYQAGPRSLGVWVDTHIFRICQELAVNAAKHAKPSLIRIRVTYDERQLRLEVLNDGLPKMDAPKGKAGVGLEFVRQRVRALGGRFDIHSGANGVGSEACCEVRLLPIHYEDEPMQTEGNLFSTVAS